MGRQQAADRATITIPRDAFDTLGEMETALRSSKADIVTALTEFLKGLPPDVQASFIDRRRDPVTEVAKHLLASGADLEAASLDEAIEQARKALNRVEVVGHAYQRQLGQKGQGKK